MSRTLCAVYENDRTKERRWFTDPKDLPPGDWTLEITGLSVSEAIRYCARLHNWRDPVSETILQEAQRLVHGDRGADYGHPGDDYKATGEMWGAILERCGWKAGPVDPRIACLMMAAMKVSREAGKHKRDNLTDLAGYAECAQMIAERDSGEGRCVS